eukprot:GFKZ01000990.1.p1 GENE.GFKZ01000990.1~~GFKZ01000990.1.p1  ORF type:complete len:574 (+),score=74.90 GFKZ01000990.1:149-1870(+)
MLRRLNVPARRLLSSLTQPPRTSAPIHATPVPNPTYSRAPLFLASAVAASALYLSPSLLHTEQDSHRLLTWPGVIRELQRQQQAHDLPPFSAHRHSSDDGYAFTLILRCKPSTEPYPLLVSLVRDLLGGEASVIVDDTATRTVFTLSRRGSLEVAVSVPRVSPFETTVCIELTRSDGQEATFSAQEVDALVRAYVLAHGAYNMTKSRVQMDEGPLLDGEGSVDISPPGGTGKNQSSGGGGGGYDEYGLEVSKGKQAVAKRARAKLEELGVEVFSGEDSDLTWGSLAGYAEVKQQIENTLTLPLKHPDVYESIVRGTRERFESNLPKAVLYEGPPGCGKTLSAKILAASIGVPFVHVPLESILSKFYGETTRKLAEILQTANDLGRCLVFIDECDSVGLSRSSSNEVHEVTRRTLSVLLRHIDGMDGPQNTILLAATNHKEDIDAALMSRFDVVVSFPLPDLDTRKAVLALYAKHLTDEELGKMAELSGGFSGRELLDVCEEAERAYGGYLVRKADEDLNDGERKGHGLPRLSEYVDAIQRKVPHVVGRKQGNPRAGEVGRHTSTAGALASVKG